LCRLPVAKNRNLGKFLTVGDPCTDPRLLMMAKFGADPLHLQAKFHVNVFIALASGG